MSLAMSMSAPSLRGAASAAGGAHPTPATRHALKDDEIPNGWTVPRYAPRMADYIYDVKTAFLKKPEALPAVGEQVPVPKPPARPRMVEEDAKQQPVGWSVKRYDMGAAERAVSRKYPRGQYLPTKELVKRHESESRPGGLAVATEEDCDRPYGWSVKRYAPHMAHFHTDAAMGWTHLRSTRAPQHDGATPQGDGRQYMHRDNVLRREPGGRAALDKRSVEENAQDVPYGWNVPRYAPNAIPRINRSQKDPCAIFYGGATPAVKHSRSEFRA
eukprot:TRINITY_DN18163_c0_g1_i1.p1 TRINITY_DN18163_c0_g1~~TRINITY_DN18163_c0_g1_i1.p1  ORF type:complete len:272 (-),score=39.42 TRINITY_DN18163_c0_g1_i1:110-925(-)